MTLLSFDVEQAEGGCVGEVGKEFGMATRNISGAALQL